MEKQYRLPKEFAEKWLAALRSGEYEQGIGELVSGVESIDNKWKASEYCCLGVAGSICGINVNNMEGSNTLQCIRNIARVHLVPDQLIDVTHDSLALVLMRMNDGYSGEGRADYIRKHSFIEIADWVEQNIEFY